MPADDSTDIPNLLAQNAEAEDDYYRPSTNTRRENGEN